MYTVNKGTPVWIEGKIVGSRILYAFVSAFFDSERKSFFFVFFSDTNPIRDRFLVGGRHESVPMRLLNRCWEKEKQACYLCRSWRFVVRKLVSKTVGSYFQAVDDLLVWLKSTQLLIDWKLNDRDSLKTFARLGLLGYVYMYVYVYVDSTIYQFHISKMIFRNFNELD